MDLSSRPFTIRGTDTTVKAHSVIVATGATAKKLGLPSEQKVGSRWWARGQAAPLAWEDLARRALDCGSWAAPAAACIRPPSPQARSRCS